MKARWLLNLGLLLLVAGIALALYLTPPKPSDSGPQQIALSTINPATIQKIRIEFPAKVAVALEQRDGYWYLVEPYKARANQELATHLVSILAATSVERLPGDDLSRYDLHQPALRLKLDNEELLFGTHNPLNSEQYVAYRGAVYLLPSLYGEAASTQLVEMLDKHLVSPKEEIVGFDFSGLEQWAATGLSLQRNNDQWEVSIGAAKPVQKEINAWFDENWKNLTATSVETHNAVEKTPWPSFVIKLKNGKNIRVAKLRESPELQLYRPDEGLLYHFPQDVGFVILNPSIGFKP
jgi:hypothetical protein